MKTPRHIFGICRDHQGTLHRYSCDLSRIVVDSRWVRTVGQSMAVCGQECDGWTRVSDDAWAKGKRCPKCERAKP